jgi:hypothetical protein
MHQVSGAAPNARVLKAALIALAPRVARLGL